MAAKLRQFFSAFTEHGDHQADKNAVTDQVVAAIALAFELYDEDLHDTESNVLTIKRVSFPSPWSAKIYGTENRPVKNTKR